MSYIESLLKSPLAPPFTKGGMGEFWMTRQNGNSFNAFVSVCAFMGSFASEDIIAERSVDEDHRQNDDGADEEERLRGGCRGCVPKRDLEGTTQGQRLMPRPR